MNSRMHERISRENFPYNPSSPYAASKASADHLINSYIRTFKLPIMISNCCNNFGPHQFPEKLIPKLMQDKKAKDIIQNIQELYLIGWINVLFAYTFE